jgi:hypothetical protein
MQTYTLKLSLKAFGRAFVTACINAALALALMLLVEFAVSGAWTLAPVYLYGGLLIWTVVLIGQLFRQYRLGQCHSTRH